MIILLWFLCCFLMTACVVLLKNWLLMTANDCCEGRRAVKVKMVLARCLTTFDEWSKNGGRLAKCSRKVFETWSIKYETLGTGFEYSGEDIQNTGTFIVVRTSVFAVSSAQITHLARDAYDA